ncbi:hypothetical protein DEO23_13910 [Brachybacterium endophyticum]|uniref:Uncharacterized protein n=1 Tax=Brachybacterium endophyticum TaxID=2182385 RepID=A0A2U2RH25_9MICO|nr:hypothetical protein [Brachybacterium endophyticum]PWH05172.1 hypothetical protein DEO23_13910 [Brachybacterium endophyticum]
MASTSQKPSAPQEPGTADRPATRRLGTVLLAVETLALAALGVFMLSRVGSEDVGASLAVGLAVFILLFALAVGIAAYSLFRRGRFGLGFGITWQLFQALVSASMLRANILVAGGVGLLLAIAAFVVLLMLVRATPLPFENDANAGSTDRRGGGTGGTRR